MNLLAGHTFQFPLVNMRDVQGRQAAIWLDWFCGGIKRRGVSPQPQFEFPEQEPRPCQQTIKNPEHLIGNQKTLCFQGF